jgi:predicted RNase H-like HicB family nuclease
MPTVLQYPVALHPAEEGGYCVTSPLIPIFTQGDTQEEALKNAEEAILCHLEGLAKDKKANPNIHVVMVRVEVPDTLSA